MSLILAYCENFRRSLWGLKNIGSDADITTQDQQAFLALESSERIFRAVFNGTFQFTWLLTLEGMLVEANQTALDFGGLEPENVVGYAFWETQWWRISPETQTQLKQAIAIASQGELIRYEVDVLSVGQAVGTIDFSLKPLTDETGKVLLLIAEGRDITDLKQAKTALQQANQELEKRVAERYLGSITDISERKLTQEALRRSEEWFRNLVEASSDWVWEVDENAFYTYVSPKVRDILGYEPETVLGKTPFEFMPPEEAERVSKVFVSIATARQPIKCLENINIHQDGHLVVLETTGIPVFDVEGKFRGYRGMDRDITDRKVAEESLLRFCKAMESTSDAICMADITGKAIYVNSGFTELYEYTLEEFQTGGALTIFQHPAELQQVFSTIYRDEPWRGEVTMRSRSGCIIQIYLRADAIKDTNGKIIGTVATHTDVTQRRQAEEGLRLRDRAIAASSNGIIIADASIPNGPIIYVNPAFEYMTGYSAAEVIGQNFRLFQSTDVNQLGLQELTAAMQEGKDCTAVLYNYRKNGSILWIELNISPVYDAAGSLTHYVGIQTDITERKQAEIALLVSQQRLQYLLHSSPAVIYTSKTSGDFGGTFVSENISTILGYEAMEIAEDSSFWVSHIHPEDWPDVFAELSKVSEQEQYNLEYRFLHKDGSYRWLYDKGKLLRDDTGNSLELVGYLAEITDRKQLEQELRVALEKEKELGELKSRFVSMTSHEFRTPLSTILSSSELLEHYRQKWTEEKQLTHLHRIQTAVKRMTDMLNDVLMIGKVEAGRLELRPKSFDLVAYCRHLVAETHLNLNNQRVTNFISQDESVPCCMDDKLLEHILGNLLSNAIKYSPANSAIEFTLTCQNGQAIFEIQDWGIGIPPEDLPRLFESFYRAHNVGNILGTGLGLAIVKRCVDIHQGKIFVTSTLGVGTLFTVTLPLNNQNIN
jgi:PAS domain S-box-containing protein